MKFNLAKTLGMIAAAGLASQAGASGYEKSIMFGGRTAGVAGVATPYIQGSEALYFNPAGLARDKVGQDISLNLSPLQSQFKAPISADNVQSSSEKKTLMPLGLMYGRSINENLGVGIGVYTSAGSEVSYKDVHFTGYNGAMENSTDFVVNEIGLGAGYKVNDNLKVGIAYRISMATANFKTIDKKGGAYLNAEFKDLKDTNFTGFKLGLQYKLNEKTDLGLTYRSNVPLKAKGKVSGYAYAPNANPVTEADITAATTFPDAFTLGVRHGLSENWNLYGEYVFTQYGRVKNIQTEGDIAIPALATTLHNQSIQQTWKDQHNIRLAGEYLGWGMPVRFGYVWTSQVADNQFARAAFTPPGDAHTFTLGTGKNIGEAFSLDGGFEYTMLSGDGHAPAKLGTYEVTEYALHLGLNYTF